MPVAFKITSISLVDPNQSKVYQGQDVDMLAQFDQQPKEQNIIYNWFARLGSYTAPIAPKDPSKPWIATLQTDGVELGIYTITLEIQIPNQKPINSPVPGNVEVLPPATLRGSGPVTLGRTTVAETKDVSLWVNIRQSTDELFFPKYQEFIDEVMCVGPSSQELTQAEREALMKTSGARGTPFPGVDAYQMLKTATEVYVMLNCRVLDEYNFSDPEEVADYNIRNDRNRQASDLKRLWDRYLTHVNGKGPSTTTLPYLALIRRKLGDQSIFQHNPQLQSVVEVCDGIMQQKLTRPCFFELIWSYWHEEGMLVQTLNAIARRFQNQRTAARDPLANFDIDPLRPLSNLIWGYIQDEQHRLTVARRAYEYDHHYGISLHGKAVPELRSADSRSKFLEALHNLLTACVTFYKQDDNTTIIADGFPVLNGLKEVHLLLAEGAHNQFGDLPSTARIEMLVQQWILARPEMREFIGGRTMVPYTEAWMDRVDGMKKLQNWTDVTVTYFNELARFGEQLLLSIRYGSWSEVHDARFATNWARNWRPEVKQYIHAYRAVTGVDLAPEAVGPRAADRDLQPSIHLRRRLELQHRQHATTDIGGFGSPRQQAAARNGDGTTEPGSPRRQVAARNGDGTAEPGSPRRQVATRNGGWPTAGSRLSGSGAKMEFSEDNE
jgi:hypothetical protein